MFCDRCNQVSMSSQNNEIPFCYNGMRQIWRTQNMHLSITEINTVLLWKFKVSWELLFTAEKRSGFNNQTQTKSKLQSNCAHQQALTINTLCHSQLMCKWETLNNVSLLNFQMSHSWNPSQEEFCIFVVGKVISFVDLCCIFNDRKAKCQDFLG